ncbi:type II toxin-antitoxin system PemK/MazF family toxin [Frondihabitans sp. 762G35]|uniref:type II toxin-antitoxin system PemK/MazF family toxin n=1 Tax=Frondihabitans sp. 762G35 TaxID=1446794 RepID=UPI003001F1F2
MVDFGSPRGSEPAKIRPAVVTQENWLLATDIGTVLVVPLTSNTALEGFPGNVLVPAAVSGLAKDSVAVVSQIGPVSRRFVDPYPAGHLAAFTLARIAAGVRLVTGV